MEISELMVSKYLKKEDFPSPTILTVREVKKEDVSIPGEEARVKGVMYFHELSRGLVLNPTNLKRAARIFGSTNTNAWAGKKVVVYTDPDVEFSGKTIGGLRLRAPAPTKAPPVRESENPADYVSEL